MGAHMLKDALRIFPVEFDSLPTSRAIRVIGNLRSTSVASSLAYETSLSWYARLFNFVRSEV